MISKLIILRENASSDVVETVNALKSSDTEICYFDFNNGLVDEITGKNLFIDMLMNFIREKSENTTVNLTNICILNDELDVNTFQCSRYGGDHIIRDIVNATDNLSSWDFITNMMKTFYSITLVKTLDFIDINHLICPKSYDVIFEHINSGLTEESGLGVNHITKGQEIDTIKSAVESTTNWIQTLCTTLYSGETKTILNKYFNITNSTHNYLSSTFLPIDVLFIDDYNERRLHDDNFLLCLVPLYKYTEREHYELLTSFINNQTDSVCLQIVYENDTKETLLARLRTHIGVFCDGLEDHIRKTNTMVWFNPLVDNVDANLSEHITCDIAESTISNLDNLTRVELTQHFLVYFNEFLVENFNFQIFDDTTIKISNFQLFNAPQDTEVRYNIMCEFLHKNYFVSNIVNMKYSLIVEDILSQKTIAVNETAISSLVDGDDKIYNITRENGQTNYETASIHNIHYFLSDDVVSAQYLKRGAISNVILYDTALSVHLEQIENSILPNTLIMTFNDENTYDELKSYLRDFSQLNGVALRNIAIFQDNNSTKKHYSMLAEEESRVKYVEASDPSLNTWSKFQDFVQFLDAELNIEHLDLLMCKIYSNSNWKYVIDKISQDLTSLEIRSSENNTGHTMFEGDWILESPLIDVNLINLYFTEEVKNVEIQLGILHAASEFSKVGWMTTSHRWIKNDGVWDSPLFALRCHMYSGSDTTSSNYSFTVPTEHNVGSTLYNEFTINFDNDVDVLVSQTGNTNSYNYSNTITKTGFTQKTHQQSPGNLYVSFDDAADVDENTWFIPVNAIWNGMNHGSKNITIFSDTDYWGSEDISGYEAIFGTFSTANQSMNNYGQTLYFYVGPYTTYSGIPNPLTAPDGYEYPKLTNSGGSELTPTVYVENSKKYVSYQFTSSDTIATNHNLTNVDVIIVAGGGGGQGGSHGWGGGGGGVVVATGLNSITADSYTITIGDGGAGGSSGTSWYASAGSNSSAFGFTALGGGSGNSDGGTGTSEGGSGGGNESSTSRAAIGYHSTNGTFTITSGSANYNNDSTTYPDVLVYGNSGGGNSGSGNGSSPGGGGAGAAGGNGNNSNYNSGDGGIGIINTFATGINKYYAGGGGGGNLHSGLSEGAGGLGGGGAGGETLTAEVFSNVGVDATANTGGGGGGASANPPTTTVNGGSGGSGIVILRFALEDNEQPVASVINPKIYNNDTGVALSQNTYLGGTDPSVNYTNYSFSADSTIYLNYDISAEIRVMPYVAPAPPPASVKYVVFQRVSSNVGREAAIGEIECVLDNGTNVAAASNSGSAEIYEDFSITNDVASWSTVSTFMAGWTNGNYWADKAINGTTSGNYLHINHASLLVSTVITLSSAQSIDDINYLYVYNSSTSSYFNRMTEHRFVLLDTNKNVVGTTDVITAGAQDYTFYNADISSGSSGSSSVVSLADGGGTSAGSAFNLSPGVYNVDVSSTLFSSMDPSSSDVSFIMQGNTLSGSNEFSINYVSYDISLSTLTNNLSILPVESQKIPFIKSNGTQEKRSVTLYGGATYNPLQNEYYFPGDLSGYASIAGELFGDSQMSMVFMCKADSSQTTFETGNGDIARNTIVYFGQSTPSEYNQNAQNANDFAIYHSPNDKSSVFFKESASSIEDIGSATFGNTSGYNHIVITMNEDLTITETNGFNIYLNGVFEASGNLSANNGALITSAQRPLQFLGKGPLAGSSGDSAFKGYLKNVRIYDKVLSASEVTTIYTNHVTNSYSDTMNYANLVTPDLVISSTDISSGDHTLLTSISVDVTATSGADLTLAASDITVVNGAISSFTSISSSSWSFTFTPTTLNEESSLFIAENSLVDNTVNDASDKAAWWPTNNNHESNLFEFVSNDVSFDLNPTVNQSLTLVSSGDTQIAIPIALNGGATYDVTNNEYYIPENGYLSVSGEVIRDGDLTISMLVKITSGNQYGNDQLVNFTDVNSLDTTTDSTDIHVFRDGTTPGAWFYYGSPDDNAMAISEAGLIPSTVGQTSYPTPALSIDMNEDGTISLDGGSVDTTITLDISDKPSQVAGPDGGNTGMLFQNTNNLSILKNGVAHGIDTSSNWTMDCYFKSISPSSSQAWRTLAVNKDSGNTWWVLIDYNSSNIYDIGYYDKHGTIQWWNGSGYSVQSLETSDENWHRLTVSADGTNTYYYIDGSLVATYNYVVNSNYMDVYRIGNNWNGSQSWGHLAGFRLYQSSYTPDQIRDPAAASEDVAYTHLAITVKEGEVKRFYINGESVSYVNKYRSENLPVSRAITGGERAYQYFGYGYASNRGLTGYMKNIRIYNKRLSSSEIMRLYLINKKYDDNEGFVAMSVSRPTLTFSSSVASGSSLSQSTLDMTLTASDDSMDGNISSSDIIATNGTISSFTQTTSTTWDFTFTSDYDEASTKGSVFIEYDSIYNNDASDVIVDQTQTYGNANQTSVLNVTISGTPEFGWPVLGNYGVGATNAGGIAGGPVYPNPSSGSEPHYICIFDGGSGVIKYSFFNITNNAYTFKARGYKTGFNTATDYFSAYIAALTTSTIQSLFNQQDIVYDTNYNYPIARLRSVISSAESWWSPYYNEMSNRFIWNALNSGISGNAPTRPSLTFSSADVNSGSSLALGKIAVSLYVSSNVLNILETDLSFTNGVISDYTKSANNYYTFHFTSNAPSSSSTIYIPQDTISNSQTSSNFHEASNTFTWTWNYSVARPDITITSSDVSMNGNYAGQSVNMTLDITNDVLSSNSVASSIANLDVSAVNGYIFDISVVSQSQIDFKLGSSSITNATSLFIPQDTLSRVFNNVYSVSSNNASNVFTWNYDSADLTITSLEASDISDGDYTNSNPLWLEVVFSESVYNFNKSYITATNCKVTNIVGTGTTFAIKLETFVPTTASIAISTSKLITTGRGLQKYILGPSNLTFGWLYDNTNPQITMTPSQDSGLENNQSYVDISFTTTESTSNFTISSLTLTGDASLSNFTGSGTSYGVRLTPISPGAINLSIAQSAFTDIYGNGNDNSVSFDWTYDNIPPLVTIGSTDISSGGTSADPNIDVYFTVSKPVSDFVLSDDANVINGTLSALTKTTTFVDHQTQFVVTVATKTANHAYNGQGSSSGFVLNGSESPELDLIVGQTYTFDQSDSTNAGHPILFYEDASKTTLYSTNVTTSGTAGSAGSSVQIVIDADAPSKIYYQCSNHGLMGNFGEVSKKESYVAKLYPSQVNTTVSLYIFAGSVTDSAGNPSILDSNDFEWLFAGNDLLVTLSSVDVANNNSHTAQTVTMNLVASDDLVDFLISDISCSNGTISNIVNTDSRNKSFDVTSILKDVPTEIEIPANMVQTSLGAQNISSNLYVWTYSPPIPTLTISTGGVVNGGYSNDSYVDLSFVFKDVNVVFGESDIDVSGGTITGGLTGSAPIYEARVTPSGSEGDVVVGVQKDKFYVQANGVQHYNDVSYEYSWYHDSVAPSITIGSSLVSLDASTNLSSIVLNVTSDEYVTDLAVTDFTVSNAVLSNLSDSSGSSFTVDIEPVDETLDASISVYLGAGGTSDRAGNTNAQSNTFAFSYQYVSRQLASSAIETLFDNDTDIPADEKLSSSEIDLVISAAFTIPDTTNPFSSSDSNDDNNDNNNNNNNNSQTVSVPKITIPSTIQIVNRKVFSRLVDQIFENAGSTTSLKIDKSSMAVTQAAQDELEDVEEVVMVKSNQTTPVDLSTFTADPTAPSAAYIPLVNPGDFVIVSLEDVEYTTVVNSNETFTLSSSETGTIGSYSANDVYTVSDRHKIIFGSETIVDSGTSDSSGSDASGSDASGSDVSGTNFPCFLEGTQILTTTGYKNVEDIVPGKDKLVDKDNNVIKCMDVRKYKSKNAPYKIPDGVRLSQDFVCNRDLYITHNHCIFMPHLNKYVPPSVMKNIKQDNSLGKAEYVYYHVYTPNYFSDTIIANGIPCETHSEYIFKLLHSMDESGKLLKTMLKKTKMMANCQRERLTHKQFNKILKKYNTSKTKGVKVIERVNA